MDEAIVMQTTIGGKKGPAVRRAPKRPYPYSEDVDEASKVVAEEATDIEHAVPALKNVAVEGERPDKESEPPVFEE